MKLFSKIIKNADVPLNNIQPIDETKNNNEITFQKKLSTNSKTKKYGLLNRKKSVHVKTVHANIGDSIIEQKLPNPYNITERSKRNKIIEFNINSKYKSLYADYINHKKTYDIKQNIKINKTIMELSKIEPHIYFTRTTNNKSADARIKSKDK